MFTAPLAPHHHHPPDGPIVMTSPFDDTPEPICADLLAQLAAMQAKLASLAVIEQAKGAMMVTYGLTADAAFDLLRFHSQTQNVKLRVIAAQLAALLATSPTSSRAITQFDRLLDQATSQPPLPPTGLPRLQHQGHRAPQ